MEHPDLTAARMTRQSVLLGTLATALSQDLAVAPMIVAVGPGLGTLATMRNVSTALGMTFLNVRTASVDLASLAPHNVVDGVLVDKQVYVEFIDQHLSDGLPATIVLQEADLAPADVVATVLMQIVDSARAPVVVMLEVAPGGEPAARAVIDRVLGITGDDIPTGLLPSGS